MNKPVINEGDRVEIRIGTRIMSDIATAYDGVLLFGKGGAQIAYYDRHSGYSVEVIEKAKPKLPTEPCTFIEYDYDGKTSAKYLGIWMLGDYERWFNFPIVGKVATSGIAADEMPDAPFKIIAKPVTS
jgi:hypothetical protein